MLNTDEEFDVGGCSMKGIPKKDDKVEEVADVLKNLNLQKNSVFKSAPKTTPTTTPDNHEDYVYSYFS